ncbi:MAG: hypothetical protein ACM30G_02270 [Micromonosporaceae bacterium]
MTWLRAIQTRLSRPPVMLSIGLLMVAYLVYTDGRRLAVSALWGSRTWMMAAGAGAAVALIGVLLAALALRKRARGIPPSRRGLWLGCGYTIGMTIVFVLTHPTHGPKLTADTALLVGALASQVVLALAVAVMIVHLMRTGRGRTGPSGG